VELISLVAVCLIAGTALFGAVSVVERLASGTWPSAERVIYLIALLLPWTRTNVTTKLDVPPEHDVGSPEPQPERPADHGHDQQVVGTETVHPEAL
jgi:hypothetical protein